MPRGEYHKVGGRQAREALEHGWVKVDRATAARLFERGMPVTATGTRVHPAHFGKMSVTIDPQDRRWRGVDFDAALEAIERGLGEHPSLGQGLALFVYEGEYPLLPRGARDRMPSSEEPRVMPPELRGAEWLQGCAPGEEDVAGRRRHLPARSRDGGRDGGRGGGHGDLPGGRSPSMFGGGRAVPELEEEGGRPLLGSGRSGPPLLPERTARTRGSRRR